MRKYTSAARMPLWKWIVCLLLGLIIFLILYGVGQTIVFLPKNIWIRMGLCLLSGLLGLSAILSIFILTLFDAILKGFVTVFTKEAADTEYPPFVTA